MIGSLLKRLTATVLAALIAAQPVVAAELTGFLAPHAVQPVQAAAPITHVTPAAEQSVQTAGLSGSLTPQIGGSIDAGVSDGGPLGGGSNLPALANNHANVTGDSRTAFNSDTASLNSTNQSSARGYIGWMLAALDYAAVVDGNFGVNTDTILGLNTRRTAQGIATGVDPTWRAKFEVNSPYKDAAAEIVLIGVNLGNFGIGTWASQYDSYFTARIDAGVVLLICNEIPSNDSNGLANLARRNYLDTWPYSSTTLTASQKAFYASKRIIINTWDALADVPGGQYGKGGSAGNLSPLYGDDLHPNNRGMRILGETIAVAYNRLLARSGFTARNALPAVGSSGPLQGIFGAASTDFGTTTAITATNGESAGAGGANMDGAGGVGVSGVMPDDGAGHPMTIARSSALQTALNATQDGSAKLQIRTGIDVISGRNWLWVTMDSGGVVLPASGTLQVTLTYGRSLNQAQTQALNLNSKNITSLTGLMYGANQTGLRSAGVEMSITGPSYNPGVYYTLWDGVNILGDIASANAFNHPIMTNNLALPPDFDVLSGTRNFNTFVRFLLNNGSAISTGKIYIAATNHYTGR
jgi:roadblock/LC7 domain-containing protein